MSNPIKFVKDLRRNLKINSIINRIFDSMEKENKMDKPFWKSKTFWFNVVVGASELAKIIPLDPATTALITAAVNVALRFVSEKKVTLK